MDKKNKIYAGTAIFFAIIAVVLLMIGVYGLPNRSERIGLIYHEAIRKSVV